LRAIAPNCSELFQPSPRSPSEASLPALAIHQ
jgi:hypothetical protein